MSEPKTTRTELWIAAACPVVGLWKIGGVDPLDDGPVMADMSEHAMIRDMLIRAGISPDPPATDDEEWQFRDRLRRRRILARERGDDAEAARLLELIAGSEARVAVRARTDGDTLWFHSTSWRDGWPDLPWRIDTYIAAVQPRDLSLPIRVWQPDALPITPDLCDELGQPLTHGPTSQPMPDQWAVLTHAVGHVGDQIRKNATTRRALGPLWRERVAPFKETLAGLYEVEHPDILAA